MTNSPLGENVVRGTASRITGQVRRAWYVLVLGVLIGGCVGLGFSLFSTPMYTATATLYVTSGNDDNTSAAYQGSLASQQRVVSYSSLVTADAVVVPIMESSGTTLSKGAVRDSLGATYSEDSVLLEVSSTTSNALEAASLANSAAEEMTNFVARLETPIGGGQPLAKLTVVSPASVPSSPSSPLTLRNTFVGSAIGFVVSVGLLAAWLRFSTVIRSESDVEALVNAPILTVVPTSDVLESQDVIDFSLGGQADAEAFRRLKVALSFSNVDDPPKALLVTSADPGEGKTTTATNLAGALAEGGSRVVVVDADLRRPQVGGRFGGGTDVGLTECLRDGGDIADYVQESRMNGVSFVAAGTVPPNAFELIESQRLGEVFASLRSAFDFVVVDSPPLGPVSDAMSMLRWVDGSILVVRLERSRQKRVEAAVADLSGAGASLLGVVLTDARPHGSYYEAYSYSSQTPAGRV